MKGGSNYCLVSFFRFQCNPQLGLKQLVPMTAIAFITDGPPNTHFPLAPVVQGSKTAHKKAALKK